MPVGATNTSFRWFSFGTTDKKICDRAPTTEEVSLSLR